MASFEVWHERQQSIELGNERVIMGDIIAGWTLCILQGRLMIKMNRTDYRLTKLQQGGDMKVADPALLFKATVTISVINMSWFPPGQ